MPKDTVDHIVELWHESEPDIDPSNLEVIGRVLRCAMHIERRRERALRPLHLTPADFDVLVTLLRIRSAEGTNPTVLANNCMVTSGAITSRLDRLERSGLIERRPDPNDRRGVLVLLTLAGEQLARNAIAAVFAEHERVLEPLSVRDRSSAVSVLRRLLLSAERP
jgi:DNA-binding MarR family transcriptional regulator